MCDQIAKIEKIIIYAIKIRKYNNSQISKDKIKESVMMVSMVLQRQIQTASDAVQIWRCNSSEQLSLYINMIINKCQVVFQKNICPGFCQNVLRLNEHIRFSVDTKTQIEYRLTNNLNSSVISNIISPRR